MPSDVDLDCSCLLGIAINIQKTRSFNLDSDSSKIEILSPGLAASLNNLKIATHVISSILAGYHFNIFVDNNVD